MQRQTYMLGFDSGPVLPGKTSKVVSKACVDMKPVDIIVRGSSKPAGFWARLRALVFGEPVDEWAISSVRVGGTELMSGCLECPIPAEVFSPNVTRPPLSSPVLLADDEAVITVTNMGKRSSRFMAVMVCEERSP